MEQVWRSERSRSTSAPRPPGSQQRKASPRSVNDLSSAVSTHSSRGGHQSRYRQVAPCTVGDLQAILDDNRWNSTSLIIKTWMVYSWRGLHRHIWNVNNQYFQQGPVMWCSLANASEMLRDMTFGARARARPCKSCSPWWPWCPWCPWWPWWATSARARPCKSCCPSLFSSCGKSLQTWSRSKDQSTQCIWRWYGSLEQTQSTISLMLI